MRRLVAIVTALSFTLAAPAFAQTAPTGSPQQPSQAQPLLLDGQDAMAQSNNNCAPGDTTCGYWNSAGVWVVVGVAGTLGLVAYLISRKHSVSP
jgi:hypothetical protein